MRPSGAAVAVGLAVTHGQRKQAVPPPAVAEILKGVPVYAAHAREELVTPTGAAIVKTLAVRFLTFPELVYDRIGSGYRHARRAAHNCQAWAGRCA